MEVAHKLHTIRFCPHLWYILGFDDEKRKRREGKNLSLEELLDDPEHRRELKRGQTTAECPPDLRGGVDTLFIYCDLVQSQVVGDSRVALLRTVPVIGKYGDIVNHIFHSPHYIPLLNHDISSVQISICTGSGAQVGFQFGKSVIKLHFRKKRPTLG